MLVVPRLRRGTTDIFVPRARSHLVSALCWNRNAADQDDDDAQVSAGLLEHALALQLLSDSLPGARN